MYLLAKFLPRRALAIAAALVVTLVSAVHVQAANTITEVAPADFGSYSAIAIGADRLPVIGHIQLDADGNNDSLYVTKCGNKDCTANNTRSFIDNAYGVGSRSVSIVVPADGLPVIGYLTAADFRVAKCGNPACSTGNTLTTLSAFGSSGGVYTLSTAITLSPQTGLPILVFTRHIILFNTIEMFVCHTPSCSSATQTVVDNGDDYFLLSPTSMVMGEDRLLVFSYVGRSINQDNRRALKVLKCGNQTCSAGNTTTEVDPSNPLPPQLHQRYVAYMPSSLAIGADGFPVISYVTYPLGVVPDGYPDNVASDDPTPTVLTVAKCINAGCTSGTRISTVDSSSAKVGGAISISVPADGRPVVSYYDRANSTLKVAKCGNAACSSHNAVNVVDTKVRRHSGEYTYPVVWSSMALHADGLPIISYSDQDGLSPGVVLKVLKCGSTSCQP